MIIIPPIRQQDAYGSGEYLAPRGDRLHNGLDFACYKGSLVTSVCQGTVTKIGYPYNPTDEKKGHLRYIQVTDSEGYDARYFYVQAYVELGDFVYKDQVIGETQGLDKIYPGITDHFHFEVKLGRHFINPHKYIKGLL